MRECPVCNAMSFKDMDVCFSCMHRFEGIEADEGDFVPDEPELSEGGSASEGDPVFAAGSGCHSDVGGLAGGAVDGSLKAGSLERVVGVEPISVSADSVIEAGRAPQPDAAAIVLPVSEGGYNLVISIRPV